MDETPRPPEVDAAIAAVAEAQEAGRGVLGMLAQFRTQAAVNDEAERREAAKILKDQEDHAKWEKGLTDAQMLEARRLSARNRKLRGAPPEPGDKDFE